MKVWFWVLWSINAIIAAIVLYFFFAGIGDGTVSSFNILPWLVILAIVAAEVGGTVWLRSVGQGALAIGLLLLLAIPGVLVALFFLIILLSKPSFH
jgi:Signal transduction histidine kinase involved in nitrogen fixation and metabolism regulation